jgi:hypothetical protein
MRRRRNPFGSTRTRKMRPAITVKSKPAPRTAKCSGCRMKILKGEEATYVRVRTRRFHKACTPANIGAPPSAGPAPGVPQDMPKEPGLANAFALRALENALAQRVKRGNVTPEMEKAYDRYNKCKELALRPGTDAEGTTALRMALIEIVKATF